MKFDPILKRDLTVSSRGRGLAALIVLLNTVLFTYGLLGLYGNLRSMSESGGMNYGAFLSVFDVTCMILLFMVILVFPEKTLSGISQERDSGTLDLLIASGLSPVKIVQGKFLSAFVQCTVGIISCIPSFFMPLIFGGVSLQSCMVLLLLFLPCAVFVLCAGLFGSSAGKTTSAGTAICYGTILFFMAGPFLTAFLLRPFMEEGENIFFWLSVLSPETSILSMLLSITGNDRLFTGIKEFFGAGNLPVTLPRLTLLSLCVCLLLSAGFFLLSARLIAPARKR